MALGRHARSTPDNGLFWHWGAESEMCQKRSVKTDLTYLLPFKTKPGHECPGLHYCGQQTVAWKGSICLFEFASAARPATSQEVGEVGGIQRGTTAIIVHD